MRRIDGIRRFRYGIALLAVSAAVASLWARESSIHANGYDGASPTEVCVGTFAPHASPHSLPDLTFQDASGATRQLGDFRGRVVLLNLWATWRTPCRVEMPTLDRLQSHLESKDFEVLALSIDR